MGVLAEEEPVKRTSGFLQLNSANHFEFCSHTNCIFFSKIYLKIATGGIASHPPPKSYVEVPTPVTSNMTLFGNKIAVGII